MPTASGMPTAATTTRCVSSDAFLPPSAGCDTSEAPLAPLIVLDGREEGLTVEVRPEHRRDVDLRVRDLPEHEVGDAELARTSDEEVGVGDRRRVELIGEHGLVDLGRD